MPTTAEASPMQRLSDLFERGREWILEDFLRKWVFLGLLIGIVAGLGAIVFFAAIDFATQAFLGQLAGYDPPSPRGEGVTMVTDVARPWVLPLVVGLGGLLSGIIVFSLAPEAEGHGTDAAIDAFHQRAGRIRSRIPAIKLVASAITIGSGGSAGREGPTAQIAAGFGSWLGTALHLTAEDRRVALAVGVGAGIGAIFKAPLGGALLSAEILYLRDFELEALIPGLIASVVGYTIFASWSGWEPVFGTGLGFQFDSPETLVWYAALGVAAGLVGIVYVRMFYGTRDLFHRIPILPHLKPALAGLLVGTIAIWFPQVLSMGYGWLQLAIEGNTTELATTTMLALILLKIVATSLTIGSGGSGGVFAPGLFVGGMLGGGLWQMLHGHVPGLPPDSEPFVVVGMGALFGGIAKAPMAVMLMVAEMTGEFTMIVPAMIATSISYLITGSTTIYESQVPTRGDSPAHRGEFAIPLIQAVTVGQAMSDALVVTPITTIAQAFELTRGDRQQVVAVLDAGRLVGAVSAEDMVTIEDKTRTVRDVMRPVDLIAYPGDSLHTAFQRMIRSNVEGMLVVARANPESVVGFISLSELARVLDVQVNELARRPEHMQALGDDPLRFVMVDDAMSHDFRAVTVDTPVSEAAELIASHGDHAALVLDERGSLTGIVTLTDVRRARAARLGEEPATVAEIATRPVIFARKGQFLENALAQPGADTLRQLPVIVEEDGRRTPVGLLRRSDILSAYLRGREQRADIGPNGHRNGHSADADEVVVAEATVERNSWANGLTLAELGLPAGVVVTVVERDGHLLVPSGQLRLLSGDHVRLLGARNRLTLALGMLDAPDAEMSPASVSQKA